MRDACGPEYETLTFAAPQTITGFDPTADMFPDACETEAGQEARAQAVRYFESRPITQVEVEGDDKGYDVLIWLRIAHDPESSRLFSFLKVSD